MHFLDDLDWRVPRHDGDIAAAPVEAADNVQLDAAVDGDDAVLGLEGFGIPALFAADARNGVRGERRTPKDLQPLLDRRVDVGDEYLAAAQVADAARELARVNIGRSLYSRTMRPPMVGVRVSKSSSVMP